jgi:asparagine synthase (glutamine-hydrolysing)
LSGIAGLFQLDGAPVDPGDLRAMTSLLERRGPDGTHRWHRGPVGLGRTLLATTPELQHEPQPLVDAASGCTIVADVRLDQRDELAAALGLRDRVDVIGDAGLILAAYLTWGEHCVERLRGDFAFALWDERKRTLLCARDVFGMRPFIYHHAPGRLLAFASEPRAILVLEQVPYRLNEGRIADYLVTELEGIDTTSTFFEGVHRLPPAHRLVATPHGVRIERYWTLEPGDELRLASDEAYAEAFLEVFTEAVRDRLRGDRVGAMLSGGMDSGSVVAVARGLLAEAGRGPLPTFSAVGPDPERCVETRTIHAAMTMDGLAPHLVNHAAMDDVVSDLAAALGTMDEPFDDPMTLVRAVYLTASRAGAFAVLDGGAGDVVLSEGSHLARLIRAGQWRTAYREAAGQARFWGPAFPAWKTLARGARAAVVPNALRPLLQRATDDLRRRRRGARLVRSAPIAPEFAHRIRLADRLAVLDGHRTGGLRVPLPVERAQALVHPNLTVGRERYDRVASALAIEPRDPFLDRRVVGLCLRLPGGQKLGAGWPKAVLRRAMAGRLPDAVRWRTGKNHLGWTFTTTLAGHAGRMLRDTVEANRSTLRPYVDVDRARAAWRAFVEDGDVTDVDAALTAAHLAMWLRQYSARPKAPDRSGDTEAPTRVRRSDGA